MEIKTYASLKGINLLEYKFDRKPHHKRSDFACNFPSKLHLKMNLIYANVTNWKSTKSCVNQTQI